MIQETEEIKSSEFQPLSDFLLVKPKLLDNVTKSEGGIITGMKRSVIERPCSGDVLAVGENAKKETGVDIGFHVIWVNTKGIDIKFSDGVFILLDYQSLIGFKK